MVGLKGSYRQPLRPILLPCPTVFNVIKELLRHTDREVIAIESGN